MKKITVSLLIFVSSIFSLQAQCTKSAIDFGNANISMYNVQGMVDVVLNSTTSITVNLGSNFSTASGPDVRIYLVDRGSLTNAQLKTPAMFNSRPKIEMGVDPIASGSYTKAIPNGANISDYETVYFYCQQFDQFWDFGSFMPFTPSNCAAVLTNNTFEKNDLRLFPSPTINELNIENADNLSIRIYDIVGHNVYINDNNSDTLLKINTNNLSSGIYFVELINNDKSRLIRKFIKQ